MVWACICLSPCVFGQTAPEVPIRNTLSNGLKIILKPESQSETVAISVCIRLDKNVSPYERTVGALVIRSVFGGRLTASANAVNSGVAQVGGSLEARITPELAILQCATVADQSHEAIYLLTEAIKDADITQASLENARRSLMRETTQLQTNAFLSTFQLVSRKVQGRSEPSEAELLKVSLQDARAYYQRYFVPARIVVAVVGKFQLKRLQSELSTNLLGFPARSNFSQEVASTSPQPDLLPSSHTYTGRAGYAFVATPAPAVNSPDYPAFLTLQALLGTGHASRLFRRIREDQGIGYGIGAVYQPFQSDSFVTYVQWDDTTSGQAEAKRVKELLLEQLDKATVEPITPEELERARRIAINREMQRQERTKDRAFLMASYEVMGMSFTMTTGILKKIAEVRQEDLARVAKTYLKPRVVATLLPEQTKQPTDKKP